MKQRGFTVVELSIVLVIIGILLAAILSTQSLIGSAKAKDVVAIVDDLRAATMYFKQRYKYLPGDWPYTATEIPGVVAAPSVGVQGNGDIEGAIDAQGQAEASSEVSEAPWHLFNAGFLGKINNSEPQRRIATSYGAVHLASSATVNGKIPEFAAANPAARNAIIFFNLPCEIVAEVDIKIDNGSTATGRALGTACASDTVQWYAVAL